MSANGNGHYYSKFVWADWYNDRGLRRCSVAARGFWMDCLCVMHDATPIGHLTLDGSPMPIAEIARNAGISTRLSAKLLAELGAAGVYSVDENTGVIFCRRMVRDAQASEMDRENGKKGGNPKLKGVNPPLKPAVNGEVKAKSLESESEPPLTPPPSGGGSEGKILSVGRKSAAPQPEPPPDPEPTPAEIEAGRKRQLEAIAAMPPGVANAIRSLANAFEARYHGPGRWPELTVEAQKEVAAPPKIKSAHLAGAQLAARRAAVGVRVPA